jgi:general stress protein 26
MVNTKPTAEAMHTAEATEEATPWAEVQTRWSQAGTTFLATVRPDGRPHMVPIGAVTLGENTFYFTSGQDTRKDKNLANNPVCVLSASSADYDLIMEGVVARVTDPTLLQRLAARYNEEGWPATVAGDKFDAPFSAPTTGPAPYTVYEVTPTVGFALGTTEATVSKCTRYRF